MTRFGRFFVAALLMIVLCFALLVRCRDIGPAVAPPQRPALPPRSAEVIGTPSGLVIPVAGIRPAQLIDTFGDARGGGTRGHGALDIMAPRGTPVVAAAPGIVEKRFESREGGNTLYVRFPGGRWVLYYAHLDSYAPGISEGVRVARGQPIARVGFTGNASPEGPHLHFAIKRMAPGERWWQGRPVNPYPLLAGKPISR